MTVRLVVAFIIGKVSLAGGPRWMSIEFVLGRQVVAIVALLTVRAIVKARQGKRVARL